MRFRTFASFLLVTQLLTLNACAKEAAAPVIAKGKTVKLNYTLKTDGKVVDTTTGKKPISFIYGEKHLLPNFEKALEGLKAGDKKSFTLEPKDAYGLVNPKAIVEVPKTNFPPKQELKPGMFFTAHDTKNGPLQGRIQELKGDKVVLNFNHPLAGKTLNFDVEVVSIS